MDIYRIIITQEIEYQEVTTYENNFRAPGGTEEASLALGSIVIIARALRDNEDEYGGYEDDIIDPIREGIKLVKGDSGEWDDCARFSLQVLDVNDLKWKTLEVTEF